MKTLFEKFEVLEDPRDIRGKKYKLIDILIMTIYGILCGLRDFTNIADFLKLKEEYFIQLLKVENGTPSHDCLSDVFAEVDSKKFMKIFIEWTKEIVKKKTDKNISIDGKEVKSATDAINGGNTLYIVSAFLGDVGISIGQVKVGEKSNEITAIPELLDLLDITGAHITIDAIGTQEKTTKKIVEQGGHYVLKVKENQKGLQKDIRKYFDKINNLKAHKDIIWKEVIDKKNHGRTEKRNYYLSYDINMIKDKNKWETVKTIAYVRVERTVEGETSITDNYYIIDYKIDIDTLEEVIRDHWKIECGLHWRLDVILEEDRSRNRIGNSINNLSIARKIVFNLASLDNSFGAEKMPLQRKLTRYMLDFKYENIGKFV